MTRPGVPVPVAPAPASRVPAAPAPAAVGSEAAVAVAGEAAVAGLGFPGLFWTCGCSCGGRSETWPEQAAAAQSVEPAGHSTVR